ncbi:MAG: IPExxxVDY family protein, partial [Marinirhabdus sp.]
MAVHKLTLDDAFDEDFTLIAIHCSAAPYQMAFLLNKYMALKLHRRRTDLDFSKDGLEVTFAWYEHNNNSTYTTYDLVANTCHTKEARTVASGGLFGATKTENTVTKYVLPQYKNVDYLFKITSENNAPISKLLMGLKTIPQI